MKPEISATMAACLDFAAEHGGKLVRHSGGYWTSQDCPRTRGVPDRYFGEPTVEALVLRGRLRYSDFRGRRNSPFPVEAEVIAP